ncbi:histone deacetylase family protein [Endozoicomonas gorgoniicola]|uniref:Histone deacetylase family protein n=1 Tax=Endozoicomonas gorgoniicola TaxID=1234144 RepID=A0ABT3MY70_9GAMM|nr:histone deacetylase family protein [Endozoicomonas gorgoniicola]MCW7554331.1 histone deacetylase family protein [Endozoicomonas gorgoniicola]
MLTIYSEQQKLHNPAREFLGGDLVPYLESPKRLDYVLEALQDNNLGRIEWPESFSTGPIARVHRPDYIEFLETAWQRWHQTYPESTQASPYCFPHRGLRHVVPEQIEGALGYYSMDLTAPVVEGTWTAIRASVDCALTAQKRVLDGEPVAFALCRPPGHHASGDLMAGYCFFNNAAIATQAFLDQGADKVAILDVDYHHGHGTQAIFYSRNDVLFASLHADPRQDYPHYLGHEDETGDGAGLGFNLNLPLPLHVTGWAEYRRALEVALGRIGEFEPDYLVVSLGLDTYERDPISFFNITTPDFLELGHCLAALKKPTLFVLEGGYALEVLGNNTVAVLEGFSAF